MTAPDALLARILDEGQARTRDEAVLAAEVRSLRAKVGAVKAFGERMRWDRSINGTAHTVALMLDCIGENAAELRDAYIAQVERGAAGASGINAEMRSDLIAKNRELRDRLRQIIDTLGPGATCGCRAVGCALDLEAAEALRIARGDAR